MTNPRPQRVCFVAGTLGQGGAERQLLYMVSALSQMGIQCQILSLMHGEFYHSRLLDIGVPVIYVGRFGLPLLRLFSIIREVRRWRPDIVQSAHLYTNLYAAIAARITGSISIGANRNSVVHDIQPLGYWGKLCLRYPHAVVTNSAQSLQTIRKNALTLRPVFLLENAVDCEQFEPRLTPREPASSIYTLAVGRLVGQKRHDLYLRAVVGARQTAPNLLARIVGEGPQRTALEDLVAELNIGDVVEFLGAQCDMAPIYQQADMLVLTSDYEGTPNVVLEAMACGLPVVTTRAGAVPGLIEDGETGYVTELGDVDAIARAIVDLALHPDKRKQMGKEARARVEAQHSLKMLGPRLLAIYNQVLGAP
ncbi:MAG: glycosyltransferase [Anaerolineae bacterium]|nr:glycosyltransferase [Anaerolineae bacterium]